jgi:hypothetical protein
MGPSHSGGQAASGGNGEVSHLSDYALQANQLTSGSTNNDHLFGLNALWGLNGLGGLGSNLGSLNLNNLGLLNANGLGSLGAGNQLS